MHYCSDKKCLRHVCPKHYKSIPEDLDYPVWFTSYMDCEDRIHMKGDDDEGMGSPEVDTPSDMGGATSSWPDSTRMDTIGRNGNEGLHYDNCCPRHSEEED